MAQKSMASRNGPPPSGPPNQTLYCTNLPDKLRKPDLRLSLYTLFSTYGTVLDVVALKTSKMRGQAHVVFKDVQTSTQAMRALQGFDFFGKQMNIAYAKGKSDTIAKLDGTYRMPLPAGAAVATTELQQSIFNAPPSSVAVEGPPPGLQKPPPANANEAKDTESPAAQSAQGTKRPRDDESEDEEEEEKEEEEDAPMEEDDSDAPMEDSSDDD